jgi:arylsulfatase
VATIVNGRREFELLSASAVTAAEVLRDAGLRTGAIVNNPFLSRHFGIDRGFEDYDHEGGANSSIRRADVVVDRALDWIAARSDERFFLVVHLFDPHMDYDPPALVRGSFTDGLVSNLRLPITDRLGRPGAQLGEADREFVRAAYDEELLFVDRQLGRLFAGLSEAGVLTQGLVLLTADHGEELFDHGGFEHGHAMWDELLHVPLIAWGADVQPGRTATPVSDADLARSMLDAAGVAAPRGMGGRSLWPHLSRGEPLAARPLIAERLLYGPPELEALRDGAWKLIRVPGGSRAELYDLSGDPGERVNLASGEPAHTAHLARELDLRLAPLRHAGTSAGQADITPEMRAKLESLGYTD